MKTCPVDGCNSRIQSTMLMCRQHWYGVPKDLRDEVWLTYRGGAGILDETYLDAAAAAIASVEAKAA